MRDFGDQAFVARGPSIFGQIARVVPAAQNPRNAFQHLVTRKRVTLDRKSPVLRYHGGLTVWFTGLSSAGKTTLCQITHRRLAAIGFRAEMLDGDEMRSHLCRDLGFSKQDRDENVRRIASVAKCVVEYNTIALVAAISPYRVLRDEIRTSLGSFMEVYVNAPVSVCERREVKGLYQKARAGLIQQFTGIDAPYEPPTLPDVECQTDKESVRTSVEKVLREILKRVLVSSAG